MKKFILITATLLISIATHAEEIKLDLKSFNRLITSPRIHVILQKGERESIRIVYHDVSKNKINIEVKRNTLRVYLDDAKRMERTAIHGRRFRSKMYDGVSITAYITYTELNYVEISGDQELTCKSALEADAFRLKAYGKNEITFESLETNYFKATLYGKNDLKIKKGNVIEQHYTLYGKNRIATQDMKSEFASTAIFGEGKINLSSTEVLKVNAFGKPEIHVDGGGHVNKQLVVGKIFIMEEEK